MVSLFMKRVHAFFSGKVQGVFFRAFAKDEAIRLGLKGFARNMADGRVEIVAEGREDLLREFVETLKTMHPLAKVKDAEIIWMDAKNEYIDFRIAS
jgi:acylphosphatase